MTKIDHEKAKSLSFLGLVVISPWLWPRISVMWEFQFAPYKRANVITITISCREKERERDAKRVSSFVAFFFTHHFLFHPCHSVLTPFPPHTLILVSLFFFKSFLHQSSSTLPLCVFLKHWSNYCLFLDAFSHLYKRVCPSVRRSVGPSVHPSIRWSVTHELNFWEMGWICTK